MNNPYHPVKGRWEFYTHTHTHTHTHAHTHTGYYGNSPEYIKGEGSHGDPPPACPHTVIHTRVRSAPTELIGAQEATGKREYFSLMKECLFLTQFSVKVLLK